MANNKVKEIRCQGIPENTADELKNVADNIGLTISQLMKPHIKAIVDSYSHELRQPKKKD